MEIHSINVFYAIFSTFTRFQFFIYIWLNHIAASRDQ